MKPFTWSFSSLGAFETCPWRYYLTKVTKQVVEPQTTATREGNATHKAFELHINGTQHLPDRYKRYLPLVEGVRRWPNVQAERKFALTAEYRETTYFGSDVWLRGVYDVTAVAGSVLTTIDWKTGKRKLTDQNRLLAAAAFKLWPQVDTVKAAFAWLPDRILDPETFTRADAPELWKDFTIRTQRIVHAINTNTFPKRPSGLCREWCPVGKALCEHCGR